jgi:hypothetical protein
MATRLHVLDHWIQTVRTSGRGWILGRFVNKRVAGPSLTPDILECVERICLGLGVPQLDSRD